MGTICDGDSNVGTCEGETGIDEARRDEDDLPKRPEPRPTEVADEKPRDDIVDAERARPKPLATTRTGFERERPQQWSERAIDSQSTSGL